MPFTHTRIRWSRRGTPKWMFASAASENAQTARSVRTSEMIYRETTRKTGTNWPTMWSLRPLSLAFLVAERCCSITLDVCRNDNPTETCRIARSNHIEFLIVTKYDPSSCGLNSFMVLAFVIGSDASSSSSSSRWKNKSPTTSSTIVGLKMTNCRLSLSLSKKLWMLETSFYLKNATFFWCDSNW